VTNTGKVRGRTDPETARHVTKLGFIFMIRVGSDLDRFESHAALGTVAGVILPHLGVHWAGVNGLRFGPPRRVALKRHPAFRTVPRLI
jgi:hypothetical protein